MVHTYLKPLLFEAWSVPTSLSAYMVHAGRFLFPFGHACVHLPSESSGGQYFQANSSGAASSHSCGKLQMLNIQLDFQQVSNLSSDADFVYYLLVFNCFFFPSDKVSVSVIYFRFRIVVNASSFIQSDILCLILNEKASLLKFKRKELFVFPGFFMN